MCEQKVSCANCLYFYDTDRPGIQFKLPRSNQINCCQIVLNRQTDKETHYCPYSQSYFSWKETGTPIITADLIVIIDNQVLCTTDVRQPQLSLILM